MSDLKASWVESANSAETEFPLNNLPYGVFSLDGDEPRCGVAIGDRILDLASLEAEGVLHLGGALSTADWAVFIRQGIGAWRALRARLQELLAVGSDQDAKLAPYLVKLNEAQLHMPFAVAEYTDFYASRHHATNVGSMFRDPENALPPNWLHIPIGYNGRASSVVVSGTDVVRPNGQLKAPSDEVPHFGPSQRFDFELEIGAIVGVPSDGPLSVAEAFESIFGFVLLNDWSARDIQAWEYQPLGPFQSKATATTIGPWIVTAEALDPFRVPAPEREIALLDYLTDAGPMHYDVSLEVGISPEGAPETVVGRTNARELYYSTAQQLAHHTTSGCPMRVGDLLGSGTISGPEKDNRGSFLEISWGGTAPVQLDCGAERSFLEDGDRVSLRGAAQGDGYRIGFGECAGRVLPARARRP